ncbi:ribosomal protein S18 acetylase RimI-like enzyme [Paenibacillus amylolyticus]|uniref:Ribosomal protein S18 acetylase RimI-like enzyme n=1 Tax=Paenibacillus amylolyticus TaxID=1451 RepID=A0AAP5H121_PAEAM|nr:GNAT family N-acetyltransferase [Paenibacillus amylolyticus]MDR6722803.1 ribosomal protein S18 acetylase RimI-like enzyme [Paenibacillus amylolyticus]
MSTYQVIPMIYHSKEQIDAIISLEQQCKQLDSVHLKADLDHISKKDGDHALLCYRDSELVGLLSWYASDAETGSINAIVHPQHRRQGVFRSLLKQAILDMTPQGIHQLSYRIPQGLSPGIHTAESLGAVYDRAEYVMQLVSEISPMDELPEVTLRVAEAQDWDFMITCSSQAFGDSESWTREYFMQTNEPSRVTYIACQDEQPVGLVRVNSINATTAFIHNFCILPAYQGRKLGRAVLTILSDLLKKQEYTDIRLSVVTENERALNLYRSVGFEVNTEYHYYRGSLL